MTSKAEQVEKGRFLTDRQREYLAGEFTYDSENAEDQAKFKIRARLVGALTDLTRVCKAVDKADRKVIWEFFNDEEFDAIKQNLPPEEWGEDNLPPQKFDEAPGGVWGSLGLFNAFESFFNFYYKTRRENSIAPRGDLFSTLAGLIQMAERDCIIEEAEAEGDYRTIEVSISIDENGVDLQDAARRFEAGESVTWSEIKALEESGEVEIDGPLVSMKDD